MTCTADGTRYDCPICKGTGITSTPMEGRPQTAQLIICPGVLDNGHAEAPPETDQNGSKGSA